MSIRQKKISDRKNLTETNKKSIVQSKFEDNLSHFLTPNPRQKELIRSIQNNPITLVSGEAGTGKTLFSIQTLYQLLKKGEINQIIIIRLITDEENVGSLPGEIGDKLYPYLLPIIDNLELFLPQGEINYLLNQEKIKILPVGYIRGRSFINKGIIVEESQNLLTSQIIKIATRIGENSRLIFNGDDSQPDIQGRCGIQYLHSLFQGIEDIGIVRFTSSEIKRHPIIAKILDRHRQLQKN